jgi:diguanylate cyclase (GGDEF)-like protein
MPLRQRTLAPNGLQQFLATEYKVTSMNALVEALANLSSLRDRESLDFALVTLLQAFVAEPTQTISVLRLVGEAGDQRWQTQAALSADQATPRRDRVWVNFNTLPHSQDYRDRQMCVLNGEIQHVSGASCFTIFPVASSGRVNGVLEVESHSPLTQPTQELITSILKIYRNVQGLLDYGEKDSLTELLNRKTFDGAFIAATLHETKNLELAQPDRRLTHAGGYWLAVLDIDHFKRVNDSFGHLIGDEVLVLLARLMRSSFRYNDQLYRFGGEEFVVLMRCANAIDAHAALERFRQRVEDHDFPQVGTITVSIGHAPLLPDDTPGAGFDRADKAVYYAKGHGRNQVCSYPELVAKGELAAEAAEATDDQQVDFF